jgi:hypothetical protein
MSRVGTGVALSVSNVRRRIGGVEPKGMSSMIRKARRGAKRASH